MGADTVVTVCGFNLEQLSLRNIVVCMPGKSERILDLSIEVFFVAEGFSHPFAKVRANYCLISWIALNRLAVQLADGVFNSFR